MAKTQALGDRARMMLAAAPLPGVMPTVPQARALENGLLLGTSNAEDKVATTTDHRENSRLHDLIEKLVLETGDAEA